MIFIAIKYIIAIQILNEIKPNGMEWNGVRQDYKVYK